MLLAAVKIPYPISDFKFNDLLSFLPREHRQRICRVRRKEDKDRSLVGTCLSRYLIYRYTNTPIKDIVIANGENGKPYAVIPNHVSFNISHSGEWVVGIIDNNSVGIDIEEIKPIDIMISQRFFTENESKQIIAQPTYTRQHAFYKVWTLKESYVKAIGKGLSTSLNSFDISSGIERQFISASIDNETWYFKQYVLDHKYNMAVCAKREQFPNNQIVYEFSDWYVSFARHL